MRIYIAGPYTASSKEKVRRNVNRAIDAGIAILRKGHYPFIPHLTHYVDTRAIKRGITLTWEDYVDWDMQWLKTCDALLFLGPSRGANLELQEAKKLRKKIFRSVGDVPRVREKTSKKA